MRLLEMRVVEPGIVETASDTTINRVLKKTKLNRIKKYQVILPEASAEFVAAMENILEVYTCPHDPARPLVCLDETSQSTRETRKPLLHRPGREAQPGYDYKRAGVAKVLMHFAPPVPSFLQLPGKGA